MLRRSLLIVVGPSGVGKGTILQLLRQFFQKQIVYSVSHTTRTPRVGEQNGREYYFVSKDQFEEMIRKNEFVEYNSFNDKYYGTSVKEIQRLQMSPDRICLLEIDVNGVKQIQSLEEMKEMAFFAFIYPPSFEELESRLRKRGTESEKSLQKRLEIARHEVTLMNELQCHIKIVNDDVNVALEELKIFVQENLIAT